MKSNFMRQLTGFLFFLFLVAGNKTEAQVTTANPAVLSKPSLQVPASFSARALLVDSLNKAKMPAGQILKTLVPTYLQKFQLEMIQGLTLLYKAGYPTEKLVFIIKEQYPEMKFEIIVRLIYAAYKESISSKPGIWPITLRDLIYSSFYNNKVGDYGLDGAWQSVCLDLEKAGDSLSTVFSYIKIFDLYVRNKNYYVNDGVDKWVFGLASTRFSLAEILHMTIDLKGRSDTVLLQFIHGSSINNTYFHLKRTVTALKTISLTKEQIKDLVVRSYDYFPDVRDKVFQEF